MPEKEKQKEKINLRAVCERCGKDVMSENSSASFTNWIFGDNRCRCDSAESPAEASDAAMLSPPAAVTGALAPGTIIQGRYEIGQVIGEGGMGRVYQVYDRQLEKTFAAKILNAQLVKDAASVKRFEQEARAAAALTHANLVPVYDYGQSESGLPFIVMDYLQGQDLAAMIQQEGFLDKNRALDIVLQTCEAVAHAHQKNVIHRDLKPSNIFVTRSSDGNDIVKVLDFGIAKIHQQPGQKAETLTQTGELFGSPLYMSPEQCLGNVIDQRSDIYAIGCVLYEMLTGQAPFSAANPIKTILKHINEDPKPASDVMNDGSIPADLNAVVMRCLEKDPSDRYESVDQLIHDLRNIRESKPIKIHKRKKKKAGKTTPVTYALRLAAFTVICVIGAGAIVAQQQGFFAPPNANSDAQNLDSLSYKYFISGQYEKAIPLLEFGVKAYRDSGGREDTYLADNLQHIGKCYLKLGKYAQAEPYYKEALEIYERFGLERTMMSEAVRDYATVLRNSGRYKEADTLFAKYGVKQ